jgi:phenylpropionate dioxygenase-like ring-hydroxylating dioxygenase large terminal subunit
VETAEPIKTAARQTSRRLADRTTPFIRNCWYVAGFADEFGRELRGRMILGKPLVLYRTEAGKPVAMDDRCIHRSFPLSKSRLEGDSIVCGYHGARYDSRGECVAVPSQAQAPRGLGVRSYPVVEQGPLVWIWMGDGDGDASQIPDIGWWTSNPSWASSKDYFDLKASYIALHENLLDLTHLTFLHGATFGTPDYASAPFTTNIDDANGRFGVERSVIPTKLPPIWAKSTGIEDKDAARVARSDFLSPALHVVGTKFWDLAIPEAERPDMQIKTAHIATPATATTTHYFVYHARNFSPENDSITRFMHEQIVAAFREDVEGLEAVESMCEVTPSDEYYEVSFAADRAGVAMRRYILQRAEAERAERERATAG